MLPIRIFISYYSPTAHVKRVSRKWRVHMYTTYNTNTIYRDILYISRFYNLTPTATNLGTQLLLV